MTHTAEQQQDTPGTQASLIVLTRLEAKVDVALERHSNTLAGHTADLLDHETRLRAIEARSTVTPTALWTTVLGAITAAGILLSIADRFITIN